MDITSINNSLSFFEQSQFENIHFYPNPTSSLLALNSDKEYDIEVYDMAGNKVMALTGNTIDMSHLSSATYIVKALDKVQNEEVSYKAVSYTHLRAHETGRNLVCRLLLEKKN